MTLDNILARYPEPLIQRPLADYFREKERDERRRSGLHLLEGSRIDDVDAALVLPDLEEAVLSRQTRSHVLAVLRSLPAHLQRALILKYVDGLTVEAISHEMQRSAKGVESLLSRARAAFIRSYAALDGESHE